MTTMTATTTMTTPTTTDLVTDRERAAEAVAASIGARATGTRTISVEATADSFVTGHVVDAVDEAGHDVEYTIYLDTGTSGSPGTLDLDDGVGGRLRAWLYPADPALPALAPAVYTDSARIILERMGRPVGDIDLALCSYRPGKRAVVCVNAPAPVAYLKVVRPSKAAAIAESHASWCAAGVPAAQVIAWSRDGLIALEPLTGEPAIGFVSDIEPESLVTTMRALADRIARIPSTRPARASLASRLDFTREGMTRLAPERTADVDAMCERIRLTLAAAGPVPNPVTVHGDLHLGQVFLDPDDPRRVTGVIDIDTAGLGDPADDAAALVAQLLASAELMDRSGSTARASAARRIAQAFRAGWSREDDPAFPVRARAIVAAHVLGHALSGSIDAGTALRLAAESLDESTLTSTSRPSHPRSAV